MTKILSEIIDKNINDDCEAFLSKIESEMHFDSILSGDTLDFEWVDVVENALPYLDNIVRKPKLALITEANVEKIEKAKKTTVETVKDLSRHTFYIDRVDEKTGDVIPSKLLNIRGIDTFNTYENRVAYTLIDKLERFVRERIKELEDFQIKNEKTLEYKGKSGSRAGRYDLEFKINAIEDLEGEGAEKFKRQIEEMLPRIEKIKKYLSIWRRSEFITGLKKERAAFVKPPITKTNVILKNPNFQVAMKLWVYLSKYGTNDADPEDGVESDGDDIIIELLGHSFMIDYLTLNCISKKKKEQKENLKKMAGVLITQEIRRIVSLLFKLGIKITDEELLALFSKEIEEQRNKESIGQKDVKNKFKDAMDEYIERTNDYL